MKTQYDTGKPTDTHIQPDFALGTGAKTTGTTGTNPPTGTRAALFAFPAIPATGNNVARPYTQPKTSRGSKRIVGKSRKEVVQN